MVGRCCFNELETEKAFPPGAFRQRVASEGTFVTGLSRYASTIVRQGF